MNKQISGSIVALAIALSAGTAVAADPDYLGEAENLAAKGQLKAAEIQLKNAVRSDPKNMVAHYRLAVIELQLGNAAAAEYEAKAARAGGYDPEHTVPFIAQTYLAQQKYRQLLEEFPGDQGGNAERPGVLVIRGYAQLALGQSEEAKGSFAEAQRLAPNAPEPLLAQAKVSMAQGQFAAAETLYDRALAADPKSLEARLGKAALLGRNGNIDQALSILDELLATSPGYAPARLERAGILLARDDEKGTKADINAVLATQPGNPGAIYLDAVLAAKAKDFHKANDQLQKISKVLSSIPRGYYVLGLVQFNLQQFEQAEDAARRFVARNPDDLAGQKLLGSIELVLKRPAETVSALAKFESEGKADTTALELLARAYIQVGKTSEALAALSAAVKLAPENATLRGQLGRVQLGAGHRNEGIADLEQSLELAPSAPNAEILVIAELLAGNWDHAKEAAEKLKRAQPDSPVADHLSGVIALARFDLEGAHAQFAALADKYPDFTAARLNLARVLELQGKPDQAAEVLQRVLKDRPSDGVALDRLVGLLLRQGKGVAAIAVAERAHAAVPTNDNVTAGLIDLYLRQNEKDKALILARQESGKNEPNNIRLIISRGHAELAAGLKNEAASTYRRLVEIAPSNIDFRRQLATVLLGNGDNAGAQQALDQALELQPQNGSLIEDKIVLAFKTSGLEAAVAAAKELRSKKPDLPISPALEGDAYLIAGEYAKAAEAYAAAFQQSPSANLAINIAKAKSATGDADGAASVLRDWFKGHPDDKFVLALLSTYDLMARRFDAAREELESVGDKLSQDPVVLNNLAWLYQKIGDPRARSVAERAYLTAPNLPQTKDTLAWILVQEGQGAAAVGLLQEASAAATSNPDIRYHLAVALSQTGRQEEALKILTELIKGPGSFDEKPEAEKLLAELSKK